MPRKVLLRDHAPVVRLWIYSVIARIVLPITRSMAKFWAHFHNLYSIVKVNQSFNQYSVTVREGWKTRVLSIMPKIPDISVGSKMERPIFVSFNWNIRDHLYFWQNSLLPYFSSHLCRELSKGIKMVRAIPLGWPGYSVVWKMLFNFPWVFPPLSVSGLWFVTMESTQGLLSKAQSTTQLCPPL